MFDDVCVCMFVSVCECSVYVFELDPFIHMFKPLLVMGLDMYVCLSMFVCLMMFVCVCLCLFVSVVCMCLFSSSVHSHV